YCAPHAFADAQTDAQAGRLAYDSGWRLVAIGFAVLQVGLAAFMATCVLGYPTLEAALADSYFFPALVSLAHPFVSLVLLPGSAALIIAFIGLCLCWNTPGEKWLRNSARVCVVLVALMGLALASAVLLESAEAPGVAVVLSFAAYGGVAA